MQKHDARISITTLLAAVALSGCAATGGINGTGSGNTTAPEPEVFAKHFALITTFGNYDVNNPRLAEGGPDGQYAVVEPHGSLTLDIGSGLSFYDGSGTDVFVQTDPERNANYTVHVSYAGQGNESWTEIGRGYGPAEFDFHAHTDDPADFIQIRNEGSEPLYLDAAKARYVRRD